MYLHINIIIVVLPWMSFSQSRNFASRKKNHPLKPVPKNSRKMYNSCTSVFQNTCAWEQQELNKTKTQTKKVKREEKKAE